MTDNILFPLRILPTGEVEHLELRFSDHAAAITLPDGQRPRVWNRAVRLAQKMEAKIATPEDERDEPLTASDLPRAGITLFQDEISDMFNGAFEANAGSTAAQVTQVSKILAMASQQRWCLSSQLNCISTFDMHIKTVKICDGLVLPLGQKGGLERTARLAVVPFRYLKVIAKKGCAGISNDELAHVGYDISDLSLKAALARSNSSLRKHGFTLTMQDNRVYLIDFNSQEGRRLYGKLKEGKPGRILKAAMLAAPAIK